MKFQVIKCSDWKIYDIENVSSINWKGSVNSGARSLELVVANNGFIYSCGDIIVCIDDFKYQGQILERDSSNKQPTITLNSMDYMIHLENSSDTIVVNSTPENVAKMICNKIGIQAGEIVATGQSTGSQIFKNKTYYDIIDELYKKVDKNKYQLYMNGSNFCVRKKGNIVNYVLDDSLNCERIDSHESIKEIINKVVKYDKDNKFIGEKTLDNISKYGIFQDVASQDDNYDDILKAEELSLKITGIGNLKCTSGNYIRFKDSATGIMAIYEITEDNHKIENNHHRMSLTLEFRSI